MSRTVQGKTRGGARRNNPRGQGERLREQLIEAAGELVAESGDAGRLSLRAVAARVGVAATSVYLHFANLDQLKIALVERGFAELAAVRDAASEGITDPAEALVLRCQAYARFAVDRPGLYRLMFGPDLPAVLAYQAERSPGRDAFDVLAESIRRCQDTGAAPADAHPARLATLVWTALHGQVSLRTSRPSFPWPPLDEMIAETVRRLVGLRPDPPAAPNAHPHPASRNRAPR
jgi:AcrR family transcriptional regulator